jgi:hypothetical protein
VQRVLVTGMSGTGKSTVIAERAARGYKAIDTDDDDWHAWVTVTGEPDRVWLESDVGVAQVGGHLRRCRKSPQSGMGGQQTAQVSRLLSARWPCWSTPPNGQSLCLNPSAIGGLLPRQHYGASAWA